MKDVALEIHKQNYDVAIGNVVDTGVSVDGTGCTLNGERSAGKMEVTGVERTFARYSETHKHCYTDYYGDGDSKSFSPAEHIYSPKVVKKGMYRTCTKTGRYTAPKT